MSPLLLLAGAPWTWHAEAGAQVDGDPHGVVNAGVANDDFAVELVTDTIEMWWRPAHEGGRAFLGLRAQGYASQLFVSPWTRGAKDRSRALVVPHAEIAAGAVEDLGAGFYAGVRGSAKAFWFFARSDDTSVPVPEPTFVITPEASLGWWSERASFEVTAGADVRDGFVSGRAELRVEWRPRWIVGPRIELDAAAGHLLDDLTKARVGGLNPYVVPVAGAAWAEWWVEDYAAARAGPEVSWSWGSVALVTDAAVFDDETRGARFIDPWAVGFALLSEVRFGTFFASAALGYAPWIERQEGAVRISGWLLLGTSARAF
jgi:hypothetical protein